MSQLRLWRNTHCRFRHVGNGSPYFRYVNKIVPGADDESCGALLQSLSRQSFLQVRPLGPVDEQRYGNAGITERL